MNYVVIYTILLIAYYAYKFIKAKQKEEEEARKKALAQSTAHSHHKKQLTVEDVFNKGIEFQHPVFEVAETTESYENEFTKPLVATTNTKEYTTSSVKSIVNQSRFDVFKEKSKAVHPILADLKTNSGKKKALILAEIFNRKY